MFHPMGLAKQSRIGHTQSAIEFQGFSSEVLCPVKCLKAYEAATVSFRKGSDQDQLFLAISQPHGPVSSSTIARWLKTVMQLAGIDTSKFSAHSTRGASSSAAAMSGVSMHQILETADWSSAKTFKQFYWRRDFIQSPRQGFSIHSLSASKSRCDIDPEPSEVQS